MAVSARLRPSNLANPQSVKVSSIQLIHEKRFPDEHAPTAQSPVDGTLASS